MNQRQIPFKQWHNALLILFLFSCGSLQAHSYSYLEYIKTEWARFTKVVFSSPNALPQALENAILDMELLLENKTISGEELRLQAKKLISQSFIEAHKAERYAHEKNIYYLKGLYFIGTAIVVACVYASLSNSSTTTNPLKTDASNKVKEQTCLNVE